MKNGTGIYRRRTVEEKLMYVPHRFRPMIRKRMGYDIYYRWTWWGIFDIKLKTIWRKTYKDFELK